LWDLIKQGLQLRLFPWQRFTTDTFTTVEEMGEMGWSKDDPVLIKNLYKFRSYKANKLTKEFSTKPWNNSTFNYFWNIWNKTTVPSQGWPPYACSILIMGSIHLVNIHLGYIPHSILSLRTLPFNAPNKIRNEFSANYPLTTFCSPHSAQYPSPIRSRWQSHKNEENDKGI